MYRFPENGVETGKSECWKLDSYKVENLDHIFQQLGTKQYLLEAWGQCKWNIVAYKS